jgi:hypothetical protein
MSRATQAHVHAQYKVQPLSARNRPSIALRQCDPVDTVIERSKRHARPVSDREPNRKPGSASTCRAYIAWVADASKCNTRFNITDFRVAAFLTRSVPDIAVDWLLSSTCLLQCDRHFERR